MTVDLVLLPEFLRPRSCLCSGSTVPVATDAVVSIELSHPLN